MTSSGLRRMGLNRAECETRFQKASSAALAPSAPPAVYPATSTAPFMAPADVPDMPSMRSQGSSRRRSITPHVKAPCEPPPCRARSTSTGSLDFGCFAMRTHTTMPTFASCRRREFSVRIPFLPSEPGDIKRRQEDQGKDCADEQSAHDGEGHRPPEYCRRDRDHSENRRNRRQHDRTEPRAAGIDRRLPHALALTSFRFNLVDEDHGIFGDHAEQRQNAENGDESERLAGQQQS